MTTRGHGTLTGRATGAPIPKQKPIPEQRIILNKTYTQYAVIGRCAKRLGWHTIDTDSPPSSSSPRTPPSSSEADESASYSNKQGPDWNIFWADSGLNIDKVVRGAKIYQKVNHFPGMVNIYRKSNLARSMAKMAKINAKEYDFYPRTWVLPAEYLEVQKYLTHNLNSEDKRGSRCIIVKPSGGAQGKGIYLCMHPAALKESDDAVAQIYIHRPLLIDSFKFDLRIYALVTCVDPLRVLLYRVHTVFMVTAK